MQITSATSIDNHQLTSPSIAPPPAATSGAILKPEVTIKMTYVDKQHTQFERKYKKVSSLSDYLESERSDDDLHHFSRDTTSTPE